MYTATVGTGFDSGTPTSSGGTITSCVVTGALPSGVSINTSNCKISGTVTEASAGSFSFTVTPYSTGGAGAGVDLCIAISNGKVMGICGGYIEE
jgi:hypothetical protein